MREDESVAAPASGSRARRRVLRGRVLRAALALSLVAVLVSLVGGVTVHERLPSDQLAVIDPGSLAVTEVARGEHRFGRYTVQVDAETVSVAGPGGTVWSAPPGTAFLVAARGLTSWAEHRGYFWPDVEHTTTWPRQRITAARATDGGVTVTGELHGEEAAPVRFTVRFTERPGGVAVAVSTDGAPVTSLQWSSARSEGAGVHGFGEQFTDFDLSGRLLPIVVREQGVGRGEQPLTFLADVTNHGAGGTEAMTYAAWASYVTDDLQGVRLDPATPSSHSFAVADTRHPDRVSLEVWAPELSLELSRGDTPTELLTHQLAGIERPPLADWTQHGAIVGIQGGTERVRKVVARLQQAGVELTGVWLQDWTGRRTTEFGDRLWWTWQLDRERYPGWADLVADLRRQGIRTTTYVNPWLVDAAPKGDPGIENLWQVARDREYLVRDPDGGPYLVDQGGFDASLVDLTNPAARDWFADVIAEEVLGHGVAGFMADFGEGLPMDAVLHRGDARELHNAWPLLWARTVEEACRRVGRAPIPDRAERRTSARPRGPEEPCVTWFRAGSLGMAAHSPAFWNGDQLVTFGADDGLASALLGTFSAGVSGWPVVHSDVGGYTSVDAVVHDYVRGEELLARWGEYAAFGPLLRSHEGNRPDENRQVYDPGEIEAFARNSRIFAALAPYRSEVLAEAARTGVPAVRHTWVNYPDSEAASNDRQFFLGDAVLVAPVLTADVAEVEVAFPPGRWVHLVTGQEYAGGRTTTVAAPVGVPAAFVAADHPMAEELVRAVRRATRAGTTQ